MPVPWSNDQGNARADDDLRGQNLGGHATGSGLARGPTGHGFDPRIDRFHRLQQTGLRLSEVLNQTVGRRQNDQ